MIQEDKRCLSLYGSTSWSVTHLLPSPLLVVASLAFQIRADQYTLSSCAETTSRTLFVEINILSIICIETNVYSVKAELFCRKVQKWLSLSQPTAPRARVVNYSFQLVSVSIILPSFFPL